MVILMIDMKLINLKEYDNFNEWYKCRVNYMMFGSIDKCVGIW